MRLPRLPPVLGKLIEVVETPLRFPRIKPRRPRVTTRRLMLALVLVALVLVAPRYWRHYRDCRAAADGHARRETRWRAALGGPPVADFDTGEVAVEPRVMVEHLASMRRKYERAALRPWEVVPPDPPPAAPGAAMWFWYREHDYGRALAACDEAIRADPRNYYPHRLKALILACCTEAGHRNGRAAIASATRACELSGWRERSAIEMLAAAHAEAGDFGEALRWEGEALRLVLVDPTPGMRGQWTQEVRDRIDLYRRRVPYRSVPHR